MAKLNILFIANCIVLGYIGQSPLEAPFLFLGQLSTALYFLYFILCPVINYLDSFMIEKIKNYITKSSNNVYSIGGLFVCFSPLEENIMYYSLYNFVGVLLVILIFIFFFTRKRVELLFSLCFTTFSFVGPKIQFYVMLFISILMLITAFPQLDFFFQIRKKFVGSLLKLLSLVNLLDYFINLYFAFFGRSINKVSKEIVLISLGCLGYALVSKYIYLHQNEKLDSYLVLFLYTILFFFSLALYYRFLLSLSLIIKGLVSPYIIFIGDDIPPETPTGKNVPPNMEQQNVPQTPRWTSFSLFNFQYNYNRSEYEQALRNAKRFRSAGLIVGACGVGIACYTSYQQSLNNFEMTRQNDLEEVAQGIRTRENYEAKYGKPS